MNICSIRWRYLLLVGALLGLSLMSVPAYASTSQSAANTITRTTVLPQSQCDALKKAYPAYRANPHLCLVTETSTVQGASAFSLRGSPHTAARLQPATACTYPGSPVTYTDSLKYSIFWTAVLVTKFRLQRGCLPNVVDQHGYFQWEFDVSASQSTRVTTDTVATSVVVVQDIQYSEGVFPFQITGSACQERGWDSWGDQINMSDLYNDDCS